MLSDSRFWCCLVVASFASILSPIYRDLVAFGLQANNEDKAQAIQEEEEAEEDGNSRRRGNQRHAEAFVTIVVILMCCKSPCCLVFALAIVKRFSTPFPPPLPALPRGSATKVQIGAQSFHFLRPGRGGNMTAPYACLPHYVNLSQRMLSPQFVMRLCPLFY